MRGVIALYASYLVGPVFESWLRDRLFWNFHDFTRSSKTLFGRCLKVSHDNFLPHFATHFSLSSATLKKSYERRHFKIRWSHLPLRLSYVLFSIDRTLGSLVWTRPQERMNTHDFLVFTDTLGRVDVPTKEWWQICKRWIISQLILNWNKLVGKTCEKWRNMKFFFRCEQRRNHLNCNKLFFMFWVQAQK
jgi:hypothetical protein